VAAKTAVADDDDEQSGTLTISLRDLCDPATFNALKLACATIIRSSTVARPWPDSECAKTLPDGTLAPQSPSPDNVFLAHGQSAAGPTLQGDEGEVRFECCIHPWMRTTIKLKDLEREKHD
jgi:hypothetical protein